MEPEFAVAVPASLGHLAVLVEPASVVAKAWDHFEPDSWTDALERDADDVKVIVDLV